jgi:hypothetical protein
VTFIAVGGLVVPVGTRLKFGPVIHFAQMKI